MWWIGTYGEGKNWMKCDRGCNKRHAPLHFCRPTFLFLSNSYSNNFSHSLSMLHFSCPIRLYCPVRLTSLTSADLFPFTLPISCPSPSPPPSRTA